MRKLSIGGVLLAAALTLALPAAELMRATFTLKHRDARSAVARLSEELSDRGSIAVEGEGNRIVVRDVRTALDRIEALVRELDRRPARFALSARLDLFPRARENALFSDQAGFVDMTHWMRETRPEATHEAHLNLEEGGRAECRFGEAYGLAVRAAGYDPTRERLGLKRLELWRRSGGGEEMLLSGGASLPEGRLTSIILGASKTHPPLRLHIKPSLLPSFEDEEVPR